MERPRIGQACFATIWILSSILCFSLMDRKDGTRICDNASFCLLPLRGNPTCQGESPWRNCIHIALWPRTRLHCTPTLLYLLLPVLARREKHVRRRLRLQFPAWAHQWLIPKLARPKCLMLADVCFSNSVLMFILALRLSALIGLVATNLSFDV